MRSELRRKLNQPVTVLGLSDVIAYSFLGGTLPDGISVSRSGAALYIDASGDLVSAATDVARFDYDPDTLALRGLLLESSITNKCLNYNANPTDLTGMTTGGDAAAVLSVVDDSAALADAGLDTICSSGMVYRLDNSAGTGNAQARISGNANNTNAHSISAYIRGGSGNIQLSGGDGVSTFPASSSYVRRISENIAPSPSTDQIFIVASAGEVVYFILNQLEEHDSVTSPVIVSGASATREADQLVFEDLEGIYDLDFYIDGGGTETLSDVDTAEGVVVTPPYEYVQRIEAQAVTAVTGTDVFILIGQSNMVGRATDNSSGAYPLRVQQYGQGDLSLKAASSPLDHFDDQAGSMGLARQFCIDHMAANPDRNIVLIPRADGGTGFRGGSPYGFWLPTGTGYLDTVADTNALLAANPTWNLAGFLWHQGESDSGSTTYEADLDTLISDLRENITEASDTTPFIVGRIKTASTSYDANVDAVLADTPNRVAYTAVVATEDATFKGDNLHFDGAGLDLIGGRYFTALATAEANAPAVPDQVTGLSLTAGDTQISASWTVPNSNRSPLTDYVVEYSTDSTNWTVFADGVSTGTSAIITGLTNDTSYFVRVAAVNAVGQGPYSSVETATPVATPLITEVGILAYDQASDTSNGTSYTFSGVSTSSGSVVVGISHRGGTSVSSVTIGGAPATALGSPLQQSGGQSQQFFYVDGHVGSSADVVVTTASFTSRCGVHVWSLEGADMSNAQDYTDPSNGTCTVSASVSAGGAMLGLMTSITSTTHNWTGLTRRTDWTDYGDTYGSGAADAEFASAQSGLTVYCPGSGTYDALTVLAVPLL